MKQTVDIQETEAIALMDFIAKKCGCPYGCVISSKYVFFKTVPYFDRGLYAVIDDGQGAKIFIANGYIDAVNQVVANPGAQIYCPLCRNGELRFICPSSIEELMIIKDMEK